MKTVYHVLCRVEAVVAATFLVVMVGLILLGGIARMLEHPLNWTSDIATCLFAWTCFLCADIAWRNGSLMAFDLVVKRLPAGLQKLCSYANHLIIAAFLIYLVGAGLWLSYVSRIRSFQGIPEISYSWVTMSLPVGAALLLITTLLKIRDEIHDRALAAQTLGTI